MSKVLVLGKKSYNFKNDDGQIVSGTKIHYINRVSDEEEIVGFIPLISNVSLKMGSKITTVPASYEFDFDMISGKNGKPQMSIADISYLENIDLNF